MCEKKDWLYQIDFGILKDGQMMEVSFECVACGWIWIEYLGKPLEVRCPGCNEVDDVRYVSHEAKDDADIKF